MLFKLLYSPLAPSSLSLSILALAPPLSLSLSLSLSPLSLSLSVLKYLELISKQVTVSHCLAERVSAEDITKECLGEKPRPPTGITNVSNGDDRIVYLEINDSID